jgi:hypothetical protein
MARTDRRTLRQSGLVEPIGGLTERILSDERLVGGVEWIESTAARYA